MASAAAEKAVRTYMTAIQDKAALLDSEKISKLERKLSETVDVVKRVQLRQELLEARNPQAAQAKAEQDFVKHAKGWAESKGVTADAFIAEGVSQDTLRKAGYRFTNTARGRRAASTAGRRTRVTTEQIRDAIPDGAFTVKDLEQASGASTATVRKVIDEELEAGKLADDGADPDHSGPGRAPTLYKKK